MDAKPAETKCGTGSRGAGAKRQGKEKVKQEQKQHVIEFAVSPVTSLISCPS